MLKGKALILFHKLNQIRHYAFEININENRIYGLDILRSFAILFVVIGHGTIYLPESLQLYSNSLVFDGVSIFFVLSGFLIGGILIKLLENNKATIKNLFNFWIRRWFRTLPNYYLVLFLLLMVLPYIFYGGMSNPLKHKQYLFFIQNFNQPHPSFFGEAWSLCVEEWFYLIVPLLIYIFVGILRFSVKNSVLIVAISLIIAGAFFRYFKYTSIPINSFGDWDNNIRKQVLTRLDSLMFGVTGAFFYYYYNELWKKYKNIFFGIGLIILFIQRYFLTQTFVGFGIYECVFSFSLVSLGVLFILPFLSEYKYGAGILYKILTKISIISYSLYLLNYSLITEYGLKVFDNFSPTGNKIIYARYLSYWILLIISSTILYKYFEKPMMELRENFRNRKKL